MGFVTKDEVCRSNRSRLLKSFDINMSYTCIIIPSAVLLPLGQKLSKFPHKNQSLSRLEQMHWYMSVSEPDILQYLLHRVRISKRKRQMSSALFGSFCKV